VVRLGLPPVPKRPTVSLITSSFSPIAAAPVGGRAGLRQKDQGGPQMTPHEEWQPEPDPEDASVSAC
jgi:hypothetical protein